MAAPAAGAARAAGLAFQQRRLLGWLLAWLLAIPLAVALLVVVLLNGSATTTTGAGGGQFRPSALALRDIPALFLGLYQAAGAEYELGWEYLAAIGKIETDHRRSRAAGVRSGVNFAGCCAGPMQFSVIGAGGGTWGAYGVDANHDGHKDVYEPADAIAGAAKYLKASGAPADWDRALYAYNPAGWYVAKVERQAELYRGPPVATTAGALSGMGSADAAALARNPKITFSHPGPELGDLRSGRVSPRLVSLLALIAEQHTISVFALASDHGPGSNHEAGRGVDIWMVDGDNCYPPDKHGGCWELAQQLDQLEGCLHPTELIYYFDPGPSPGSFAKADHDDHVHVGYDGPLGPKHYGADVASCSAAAITGGRGR
jgi:hypothetical protein